ncbi:MAG TPA: hypothetical protein VMB66_03570 [Candidatus Acidoferrales bacterium]|nr:hypothetical protein [Candidatus Acidoferrales bacterium]
MSIFDVPDEKKTRDWWCYLLAALCGFVTGSMNVAINDLLLMALMVTASCMMLGLLRPRWPWRWVILVGVFVPLTEMAADIFLTVKPSKSQVYASFLAFLPGIAGAYGGSFMRGVVENLRAGK